MLCKKCKLKLLVITVILSLSGCAMRGMDYDGGYSFPQSSGWYKLKHSEIVDMPQIPWFSSVVSGNTFESYDFYVKTKEKGLPDTYEAVFALTVSPKLSGSQKKALNAEMKKAKKYLQEEGAIKTALNKINNQEEVSKNINKTLWIFNSDQTEGEIMHTIQHNRRYGLYFYKDMNLLETPVDMEVIQSINLKPFGFIKGVANGVGMPIGIVRSMTRTPNEYTKKFIFGFYLDKGPEFAVYAKINNGFLYRIGFFLGVAISLITMDIVLLVVMLPTGLVSIAIKVVLLILSKHPVIGYVMPGIITHCVFLYLAFIL